MESLWVYEGPFSKTFISPIDVNHCIKLRSEFEGRFCVTLGSLLAYEGDFGSILGSLRSNFGHIDVEWQV